jgi:hypothetical protein
MELSLTQIARPADTALQDTLLALVLSSANVTNALLD